jgi:hypothetical protein
MCRWVGKHASYHGRLSDKEWAGNIGPERRADRCCIGRLQAVLALVMGVQPWIT